jgi:putative peptide zinc metalloprotease protein
MDGYKMLSQSLGMSNYATESRRFLGLVAGSAVGRGSGIGRYSRRARIAFTGYGFGAALLYAGFAAGLLLLAGQILTHLYGARATARVAVLLAALLALALAGRVTGSHFKGRRADR